MTSEIIKNIFKIFNEFCKTIKDEKYKLFFEVYENLLEDMYEDDEIDDVEHYNLKEKFYLHYNNHLSEMIQVVCDFNLKYKFFEVKYNNIETSLQNKKILGYLEYKIKIPKDIIRYKNFEYL